MKREIVKTNDNSSTLFVPDLDEHYHSIHGALQESRHVFIKAGLHELVNRKNEISILEVGFGTGLNALLTLLEAEQKDLSIHYKSLEKYPVTLDELKQLNYGELLKDSSGAFQQLHKAEWEKWVSVNKLFKIFKQQTDLKSFSAPAEFDLIYFDAFAPSAQADLWTIEIFTKMFQSLKPGGLLVTYCVKGEVRRNMKAAGFEVEKIPGPPGKREMARAWKN